MNTFALTPFLTILIAVPGLADDWTGKTVFPRVPHTPLRYENETVSEFSFDGRVVKQVGEWVEVRHSTNSKKYPNRYQGFAMKKDLLLAENAVPYFTTRIEADKSLWWAYQCRARARQLLGNHESAIQDYTEAIRLGKDKSPVYNNRGVARMHTGQLDEAIQDYTEAIRLDANNASAYGNRGFAWENKGQFENALKDYEEAIRLETKDPMVYNNRGLLRDNQGQHDKAVDDYSEAIRLDPKFALAYYNRGLAWNNQGDYGRAIQDYTEAIRLDPSDAWAYNNLAWLHATCPDEDFRDGKKAIELGSKACELSMWKQDLMITALAAAYATAGDFDEAKKMLQKAIEVNPASPQDIRDKMLAAFESGNAFVETTEAR